LLKASPLRQLGRHLRRATSAEHLAEDAALLAHGLHHVGHLPVHLHELVDVLHAGAGACGHALLARGVQQLRIPALGLCHRADHRLLALQDARQAIEGSQREKEALRLEVGTRDKALADSLAEEERLAGELEAARDHAETLRRSLEALNTERDVLARQVADLTAERAELLEARKALESVHRALTQATVR